MIVIGTDTHKQTHTVSAVFAGTGQLADELTAPARKAGFGELLRWGRELDAERIWAIEDCRHVSGSLERFLVSCGEHRHRLDRGGNRQLNCALHRIAITQGRIHPPARAYLARKQSEGKSRREALRCLKRQLTRTVWHALRAAQRPAQIDRPTKLTTTPNLRPVSALVLT